MQTQTEKIDIRVLWRILDVTRQLGVATDLVTLLRQVIDAGRDILDADRGTVFLYDAAAHELFTMVGTEIANVRFSADRGIAGECARTRQVINVPDCYADPRFNKQIDRETGYRTRCLLTVPLVGFDDSLVGVMQLLNKRGGVFDAGDERVAVALAAQCAVALQRARLIEEHLVKQKLERDLSLAREIQQKVLPSVMPVVPGYDLAGWSCPADETGGDIYDVVAGDGGEVMVLLGDATGHGIGPALSVTQMRAMFRMAVRMKGALDDTVVHINEQLSDDLADNRFITAFIGRLDPASHELRYHSGGQGPLLQYHAATGQCEWREASTIPLGIMSGLPLLHPEPMMLMPGDIVALLSDGIYEYQNPEGKEYGKQRVEEVMARHADGDIIALAQAIRDAVEQFAAGVPQADDMTGVLIRRT